MNVKRFWINTQQYVDSQGPYVDYEDYAALNKQCRDLVEAGKELLKLIDDVGIDDRLGDETDRVFPRYEFDDLRKAVESAQHSDET